MANIIRKFKLEFTMQLKIKVLKKHFTLQISLVNVFVLVQSILSIYLSIYISTFM